MEIFYCKPVCDHLRDVIFTAQANRKEIDFIRLNYKEGKDFCNDLRVAACWFPARGFDMIHPLGEARYMGVRVTWPTT